MKPVYYGGLSVYGKDLKDLDSLTDKLEKHLQYASGFYLYPLDEEAKEILKDENKLKFTLELVRRLNLRKNNEG